MVMKISKNVSNLGWNQELKVKIKCLRDLGNFLLGIFFFLKYCSLLVDVLLLGHLPSHQLLHQPSLKDYIKLTRQSKLLGAARHDETAIGS